MHSVATATRSILAMVLSAVMLPALADEDKSTREELPASNKQFVITLGGGGIVKAKYPGSDSYLLYPLPIIGVSRFYLPGLGQVTDGNEKRRGISFFPSFGFLGKRKASDSTDLFGTKPVDWAFELGAGALYRYDWVQGFVKLRQGFNGHDGQVAELGFDFIVNPADRLEIVFGPRASWASDDYMETYFGVTPLEASVPGSSLFAYEASSSFKTVGLEARANYALNEKTSLHLQGGWNRYIGDAEGSPIVKAGSENEFSIGLGLSYRFAFDVFE
jgi:outer membrane protein